ncbi:integrase zinc binding domain-containing protein, partial [Streptococcus suis]
MITQFGWARDGVLTLNNRQYIPNFDDIRLHILKARHNSALGGHQGITKTTELVERDYIWKS